MQRLAMKILRMPTIYAGFTRIVLRPLPINIIRSAHLHVLECSIAQEFFCKGFYVANIPLKSILNVST